MSDLGPDDPRPFGPGGHDDPATTHGGAPDPDATREAGLPPGAGTKQGVPDRIGADGTPEVIDGNVRHERPFEDAPGEGKLAPGGDNPPPASVDPTGLAGGS